MLHQPISPEFSHGPEVLSESIDGAELKTFFTPEQQMQILDEINSWFQAIKETFPFRGMYMPLPKEQPVPTQYEDLIVPEPIVTLLTAMLQDAKQDDTSVDKTTAKILLERTGLQHTDADDGRWHIDTNKVIFDKNLNRVGYENKRGPEKYMAFVGRPGTFVIDGRTSHELSYDQVIDMASHYHFDGKTGVTRVDDVFPEPRVVQLDPSKIWKVAVGDLLHAPAPHEDGLLITLSLID